MLSFAPVGKPASSSPAGHKPISLPPVQVHEIENNPDRRARCLKHLLKANHVNYSIVQRNRPSVNHSPHLLSTTYLLGASEAQLHALYEDAIKGLEPWMPSPAEIVDLDWVDFLGNKLYQRAYVDFFEDNLAMTFAYDWKREADYFLFGSEKPLVYGLISGLGHSLVHLAYAYELDCKEVGMEALGLACVEHDFLAKYLINASYTRPSPVSSGSPLELLGKISEDRRFDELPRNTDASQLEVLFGKYEDPILEYWNAWELAEPMKQFQESQDAAVLLAIATAEPDAHTYDYTFAHLLSVSHAVRILLAFFPTQHHVTLVREWWLLAIAMFIMRGRPWPMSDNICTGLEGKDWKYVENQALTCQWSKDAQFIKVIRALKEASKTWGDTQEKYISAAVTMVDGFHGWKH